MKIHTIAPAEGAVTPAKRIGRGIGSGLGKTSGKGHKGQWARSGGGVRPGFEGGQMPLTRRVPKRGFKNHFTAEYVTINVGALNDFKDESVIEFELFLNAGLVRKDAPYGLKVLGDGELDKKLVVKAAKFTKAAAEKIEKAGGKADIVK